jgi:2-phospho-L-lactate guanylyltransferase
MLWALVPAKLRTTAKERLSSRLPAEVRVGLAAAMLGDVLSALRRAEVFAGIAVVSRDAQALALATSREATPLRETGGEGLNQAVAQGIERCIAAGASAIVVAMGDLPLLAPHEVCALVARLPSRGVVLAPSFDGTGTNLLAARPPDVFPTSFGPDSLALHRAAAASLDLPLDVCSLRGASLDIDTLDDLERLARFDPDATTETRRLLVAAERATARRPA